ncbi:MAG: RES domain-containing protein [Cytophagaceae bacterium]|nr:MAG: RES domain-containing protein [Cytophagaceae bacterium]
MFIRITLFGHADSNLAFSQQSGIRMPAILNAPVLNTSATPEPALLEVAAHLNPQFIPSFHLLVLDIPHSFRAVSLADLPQNWQEERPNESLTFHLIDWLRQPDVLAIPVPSAIVTRSQHFLLHTLHPDFTNKVRIVENTPFQIDNRIVKG